MRTHTILLLVIVLIGASLRVRLSQDKFIHKWDERFHALVAKSIWKHPLKPTLYENPVLPYDYTKWYSNHVWLHKPPLPLWLIGASYKIFGVNEFATRIPSIVLSVLVILLTYSLGKQLYNENIGLLAAFFMAINGFVVEIASGRITTDHYDTQFMAFITLTIYCCMKSTEKLNTKWTVIGGIFLGCALLTKWLPALIVVPIYLCLLLSVKAGPKITLTFLAILVGTALFIAVPWQLHIRIHYPIESSYEQHYNFLHFVEELEGHKDSEGYFFYLNRLRINYSEIIYIPLAIFLYRLIIQPRDFIKWALFVWIFIPTIIFSFAKTKLQGYILFTSPALFILIAQFYFEVKGRYLLATKKTLRTALAGVLVIIIAIPLRYCFERTKFGLETPREKVSANDYKNLRGRLTERCIVLNVKEPIEFMFYNECIAYSTPSVDQERVNSLKREGYRFFQYSSSTNSILEF